MLTTKQKLAIARIIHATVMTGRSVVGLPPVTTVKRRNLRWVLDLREVIDFSIWLIGAFELGTVRAYQRLLRPGQTVLDVGANVGAHTLHFARTVGPTGKVYAFEPTDYAFAKLNANVAANPELVPRIVCCQTMLTEANGQDIPPLYSSWPLVEEESLHALHGGRLMSASKARSMSLDSCLAEAGVDHVDLIKIDIDGFECGMLRGARDTLARMRPTIVMELSPHQLDENNSSIEELVEVLAAAGYALEDLTSGKPLPMSGSALGAIIPYGGSQNAIARPTARPAGPTPPDGGRGVEDKNKTT
jgi:FkbM family methyltransferase